MAVKPESAVHSVDHPISPATEFPIRGLYVVHTNAITLSTQLGGYPQAMRPSFDAGGSAATDPKNTAH